MSERPEGVVPLAVGVLADQGIRPLYASGECEIDLARRELRILGSPVPVGGRAFEIIEVLAESAGELVTKDELMNRVWPGAAIVENTLQVHAAAVRKALGPYGNLLKTESRRGYRLLGDWAIRYQGTSRQPTGVRRAQVSDASPASNFPAPASRLIGRAMAVQRLRDLVSAYRVVTLTGPGGIGKTMLALKVARHVLGEFADGGWLVELASLSDPALVPAAVAGVLELRLGSHTISAEAVASAIGAKKLLLVLDNCEHVIDAAATLAETCVRLCRNVTILATSREVLRIQGEFTFRVPPLEVPATEQTEANQILGHSAPELFIARAEELGSNFASRADNLSAIAAICRDLDGIPLAIEFAAARAATLGIEQVAAGLRDRFALLTSGRRTALPRHRTLRATLDWSYQLLSDSERILLRRLAVFAGGFSLDAVNAVTNRGETSAGATADDVANLVAKSLVTSDFTGGAGYFRLLETTRIYALSRLTESGELPEFSRRHADYYRGLFLHVTIGSADRATYLTDLHNVRAALEWCFGSNGDVALGIGLAAVAAPIFLAMSLLPECHRWSEQAIIALDDTTRGDIEEMHLQAALGVSLIFTRGGSEAARAALSRSLAIAEQRGDAFDELQALGPLEMFHIRTGEFKIALGYARRCSAAAAALGDPVAITLAHSLMGISLHLAGELDSARVELEAALQDRSGSQRTTTIYVGFEGKNLAGAVLASTLWLQGYPVQAVHRAHQTVRDAASMNHPLTQSLALIWAVYVFLWTGNLRSAEQHIDQLITCAEAHSFAPYRAVGRGFSGELAIRRGDAESGIESLRDTLKQFHATPYEVQTTPFAASLAQGLAAIGRLPDAIALIGETIQQVEANGDYCYMPELLRLKGGFLRSEPQPDDADAEVYFMRSLEWSRRQGARAWELRTAIDLAKLLADQGSPEKSRALLQPIFAQFAEGLDTADLTAAHRLLTSLQ